jgi:hypothetical protein
MVTFVELPLFTEQITNLVDDAVYGLFQKDLMRQPDRGDVISQSGGLRKVRMRLPGRGKSGGARVIYLHLPKYDTIVLYAYPLDTGRWIFRGNRAPPKGLFRVDFLSTCIKWISILCYSTFTRKHSVRTSVRSN